MSEGPQIKVPLEEWTEDVIDRALAKHAASCPLRPRVERLELKLASLIAFMVGSGMFGGAFGALMVKLIGVS